jgi:hypothetical protein
MLPVVFLVTLGLVVTGLIIENDEAGDDNPSEGVPSTGRRKSTLRRLSMSVADAPRRLSRKVSFWMGEDGEGSQEPNGSQEPSERRPRSVSSFAGALASRLAAAPGRLTRKVSSFLGSEEPAEQGSDAPTRTSSFGGFAGKLSRRPRTLSCPAPKMGDDETEHLNLNAMD